MGPTVPSINNRPSAATSLPVEPGTIELRTDGSVTVTGHRVRLRRVVEAIESGADPVSPAFSDQFPTIDQSLLKRVVQYIVKYPEAIAHYMSEEREMEKYYAAQGTHVTREELRRLFEQVR